MVQIINASTREHIEGIKELQQQNLSTVVSDEARLSQGFVTVKHTLEQLHKFNDPYPHTIAVAEEKVVGYTLSMMPEFSDEVEVLKPMFHRIQSLNWDDKPIIPKDFFVMGQVCVAEGYRGSGIFRALYNHLAEKMKTHKRLMVTEISLQNLRSLRAHEAIGFHTMEEYHDAEDHPWRIVGLGL